MSIHTAVKQEPDLERLEFDLTDRLTKSLKLSGLKVEELAARMDISRATVANWTSGRTRPRKNDLRAWAAETGVPLVWLETGKLPPSGGDDGSKVSFLPGSNRRPFHYNDYASAHNFLRPLQKRPEWDDCPGIEEYFIFDDALAA